jgi:hypothetical protein
MKPSDSFSIILEDASYIFFLQPKLGSCSWSWLLLRQSPFLALLLGKSLSLGL